MHGVDRVPMDEMFNRVAYRQGAVEEMARWYEKAETVLARHVRVIPDMYCGACLHVRTLY